MTDTPSLRENINTILADTVPVAMMGGDVFLSDEENQELRDKAYNDCLDSLIHLIAQEKKAAVVAALEKMRMPEIFEAKDICDCGADDEAGCDCGALDIHNYARSRFNTIIDAEQVRIRNEN